MRRRGERSAGTLSALFVLAVCWAVPAPAMAGTSASLQPSLLPDRPGASTTLTLALRFVGGEEGVPAPLSRMVVHLPAQLSFNLAPLSTCARSRLRSSGPRGCPAGSLLGSGHAVLESHAGSLTLREPSRISVFRGPNRGGSPTIEIFGHGDSPLYESTISVGVLSPDSAPYGYKLTVSIPPMPTVMYEPNASFQSISLTLGNVRHVRRAHPTGAIVIARGCGVGGFPFAADLTFADGSTAGASASAPCP